MEKKMLKTKRPLKVVGSFWPFVWLLSVALGCKWFFDLRQFQAWIIARISSIRLHVREANFNDFFLFLYLQRKPAKKVQRCCCIARRESLARRRSPLPMWCATNRCRFWKRINSWSWRDQSSLQTWTSWANWWSWSRVSSPMECCFSRPSANRLRQVSIRFSCTSRIIRNFQLNRHFHSHFLAGIVKIFLTNTSWH